MKFTVGVSFQANLTDPSKLFKLEASSSLLDFEWVPPGKGFQGIWCYYGLSRFCLFFPTQTCSSFSWVNKLGYSKDGSLGLGAQGMNAWEMVDGLFVLLASMRTRRWSELEKQMRAITTGMSHQLEIVPTCGRAMNFFFGNSPGVVNWIANLPICVCRCYAFYVEERSFLIVLIFRIKWLADLILWRPRLPGVHDFQLQNNSPSSAMKIVHKTYKVVIIWREDNYHLIFISF